MTFPARGTCYAIVYPITFASFHQRIFGFSGEPGISVMAGIKVHVGDTAEDMGRRFSDAWRRAERGKAANERHLSFDSFETLAHSLTRRTTRQLANL